MLDAGEGFVDVLRLIYDEASVGLRSSGAERDAAALNRFVAAVGLFASGEFWAGEAVVDCLPQPPVRVRHLSRVVPDLCPGAPHPIEGQETARKWLKQRAETLEFREGGYRPSSS